MSSEDYTPIERDAAEPDGGNELPTYDDLAAQNGPNSRFGRWRGWIEKRAAERYQDITPAERVRRRERGWGNDEMETEPVVIKPPPRLASSSAQLHIRTEDLSTGPTPSVTQIRPPSPPLPPLPPVSERITPSHLRLNQFGSRFLPHTTSAIRCLLPIMYDKYLLVGHDEGLSVLDMFPQEWLDEEGLVLKGPDEAKAHPIWIGESVHQMTVLEVENSADGNTQGVVLMLVSPESESPTKENDSQRSIRMYNLASLTSLAKWAISQRGARPLDMHRPSHWNPQQSPGKRHRPQSSLIARGLKSFMEAPSPAQDSAASYHTLLSPSATVGTSVNSRAPLLGAELVPVRRDTMENWDVVEDLPLRWATDYVPLAGAGSRLLNCSILSYAIWNQGGGPSHGGQLLAVATKTAILLYETPKGERAFRFVKEFYTPLVPRAITFIQQNVQGIAKSNSEGKGHKRTDSTATVRTVNGPPTNTLSYGALLSVFVVFDKKAGWIRVADSAVGEMTLFDESNTQSPHSRESLNPSASVASIRRQRPSSEFHSPLKWLLPMRFECPLPEFDGATRRMHLLTRGKTSHIVPCPLPANFSNFPPLATFAWHSLPTHVSARICTSEDVPSVLQLVALGEDGVEVQEVPLSYLADGALDSSNHNNGKGKARLEEPVRADIDLGGDTGFLCTGGLWNETSNILHRRGDLNRANSTASHMSTQSFGSVSTEFMAEKMKREAGVYGWCRKGIEDWRVFWVGGSLEGADHDGGCS